MEIERIDIHNGSMYFISNGLTNRHLSDTVKEIEALCDTFGVSSESSSVGIGA